MRPSPTSRKVRARRASRILISVAISVVAFLSISCAFANGTDNGTEQGLANRKLGHYEDSAGNFFLALSNAARKFGIPIGFELNEQPPSQTVSIEMSDGTVADLFSTIIQHAPDYKWIETNSVVNIMPKK